MRRVAILALLLMVRLLPAQSAVVKQTVNLRALPTSNSTLKLKLHQGDELTLLHPDTVAHYLEVRTAAGSEGWVYAPRVRVLDAAPTPAGPQITYRGCSLEGNAQAQSRRELNRLKNRVTAPAPADIDSTITLDRIVAPGNDSLRWSTARGVVIAGYVIDVKMGGQETVNCGEKEVLYRDTHIELVLHQGITAKKQRVIVEVTPRWRDFMQPQGTDWTTPTLRAALLGHTVRFTGWLFFDAEHDDESENTRPGRALNWRATAWEVHPVTSILVLP